MIPAAPLPLAPGFHGVPDGHVAAVVTALEMRQRPGAPGRVLPDEVELVRVARPEPGWYRALFRAIGTDWLWASRLSLDDARLAAKLQDPKVELSVVVPAGSGPDAAIGMVELDFTEAASCEIAFFGLVPGSTGRGLGRAMMDAALQRAWREEGVTRVWVHTCTLDDPRAVPFYLSCGFRAYARQVEVLPDPRLAGLLPREAAPAVPVINGP